MPDISGFPSTAVLIASVTYPSGVSLSQWADDADPFDLPELTIADAVMGNGGDPLYWAKVTLLELKMAVIPNNEDDLALRYLMEANRAARGKAIANDNITMTLIYPDGHTATLSAGRLLTGMPANSFGSSGRLKTKPYGFKFGNIVYV